MNTIEARRRLIVIMLLCAAFAGALIRQLAAPGSVTRDIGTLMLLLWLPVIGNVVAWLVSKARLPAAASEPAGFEDGRAFHPHALVELTLRPPAVPVDDTPIPEGEHRCALVVDNQGFSARWWVPVGGAFRRGTPQALEVEFLAPTVALPKFHRDAAFRMLVGESFVGDGRVVRLLGADG